MKTKHLLITAISVYILFLLIYAPASYIVTFLEKNVVQIKVEGVTGTIWNGSAQRIIYSNSYILDDANWSICAWRLITGEACIELDAKYNNNDLEGEIGINVAGTIKARNIKTSINAETLGNQLKLPLGKLSGDMLFNIEYLTWTNNTVPGTTGTIRWSNSAITFAEKVQLGAITIEIIESDDYPITTTIINKAGHIAINGYINIDNDGAYNLELKLQPDDAATSNVRKSLAMFTKKQSDGSYIAKDSGNLKELGLI